MIIAEQKPLEEIRGLIGEAEKVLVVGCGTCVTVCFAGGEKEAGILATSLRMASKLEGQPKEVTHTTVQRQCEWEYIDPLRDQIAQADAVLSIGCGIGGGALRGLWFLHPRPHRRDLPHRPLRQAAAQWPLRGLPERSLRDQP